MTGGRFSSVFRRGTVVGLAVAMFAAVILAVAAMVGAVHRDQDVAAAPCSPAAGTGTALRTIPDGPQLPFELDFATVADGGVPARSAGFVISTVGGERSGYGLRVLNGHLCHGSPLAGDAASYLEVELPRPITRIGATATFPANSGSVALVVWQTSLAQKRGEIPNAGIHLVVGADQWHFGVWEEGRGEAVLASGSFVSKGHNTPQVFEATRTGDSITIALPDGQRHAVSDPRIAAWTGNFPTWELYEFKPGLVPAAINSIWAA